MNEDEKEWPKKIIADFINQRQQALGHNGNAQFLNIGARTKNCFTGF